MLIHSPPLAAVPLPPPAEDSFVPGQLNNQAGLKKVSYSSRVGGGLKMEVKGRIYGTDGDEDDGACEWRSFKNVPKWKTVLFPQTS